MRPPSRQLVFALPHRPALGRDDFLVTPSNAAAVAAIDRWTSWPARALVLVGPAGSGKSHLLEVWRQMSGAGVAAAGDIAADRVPALLAAGALAVEDAPGPHPDETAFFHLLNHVRQTGGHLLITSATHPARWDLRLADLRSRVQALPVAELGPPDDALLRGVLVKLFADRQLAVEEAVVSYLLLRMPRSLDAARLLVAEIDRRSLAEKAEVTRGFAARVLSAFDAPALFPDEP